VKGKQYQHLVKRLKVEKGPAGLYKEPQIWMNSKDLAGVNITFSYGFIKEPGVFHPLEGSIVHPYDELLVFAGTKSPDILYLGAEVSIELGAERELYTFTEPTVIAIPKGTPHGPVKVKNIERPIVHYSIGLTAEYEATAFVHKTGVVNSNGTKYGDYLKKLITYPLGDTDTGMGTETVPDENGVLHPIEFGIGPGNGDAVVWLFGRDLQGFEVNFTWGFYSKNGIWHRKGESHYHPEEEILVFVGLDPDDLDFLGAELEIGMGKEIERYVFNKPTVAICPKGFPHLPVITRWCDKPYGFFVICLDAEHASPWVEDEA
jgi:hypothetical protein